VQAVLTGPIVTDYVPAAKPPWVLLALAVCLLALVVPREVLPEFCVASAIVAAGGWVVNRWWAWPTRPAADPPAPPDVG
jgi:hypothetical protein